MQIKRLASFSQLAALCQKRDGPDILFRGVPDRRFELVPVLGRPALHGSTRAAAGYDAADAAALLDDFRREAVARTDAAPTSDDLEWLALGRCHGLPTQLLDWSTSPLVAAWLACCAREPSRGTTGAIYAVAHPPMVATMAEARDRTGPVAYAPAGMATHLAAQHVVYTFHPAPATAWDPPELIRYDIGPQAQVKIRAALARAGITPAVLMPGLDGVALELAARYRRERMDRPAAVKRVAQARQGVPRVDAAPTRTGSGNAAPDADAAVGGSAAPGADATRPGNAGPGAETIVPGHPAPDTDAAVRTAASESRPMIERFAAAFERAAFGSKARS